jgi:predicted amidohydrolase
MNNKLNIALIQSDIIWESTSENLNNYNKKLSNIGDNVDLIILPEMFATGFTINVDKVKQSIDGEIVLWMKSVALKKEVAIIGSVIIEEDNKLYNRAFFFFPDGTYEYYDKKHLFTLAGEDKVFSYGNKRKIVEYKGWRIMPLVCYDLRFPVWSRNDLDYDLLIYIASWPEKRRYAWQTLLKARAIENMAYVAGVNRVGKDGNRFVYSGDSNVLNPLGESISNFPEYEEKINIIELDKGYLNKVRKSLAFLNDRDNFEL